MLGILALAAFGAIVPLKMGGGEGGWLGHMVESSSAEYTGAAAYAMGGGHGEGGAHAHALFFGFDAHKAMMVVSGVVGFIGIFVAFMLHYVGRTTAAKSRADGLLPLFGPLATAAQHKWYVDEIYDMLIVKPLWVISNIFALIDKYIVDGIVDLCGWLPRAIGRILRPSQSGELNGYAVGMAGGLAVLILIVLLVTI